MYIATLREKLKEVCENKVRVRIAGCGHFYIYLAHSGDISTVKKVISDLNEEYGSDVKFNSSVGSVDGKVYKWYLSCWGLEGE